MKRNVLKSFFKLGGFRPFHWRVRDQLLILMYHRFSASSHGWRTSADQFRQHLQYLSKSTNPVSLHDGLAALKTGSPLPPNPVVITIDDGYRDAYEIAFPLIKEFRFTATLFAVTDFVDRECWIWTDLLRFILIESTQTKRNTVSTSAGEFRISGDDSNLDADVINGRCKRLSTELRDTVIREIAEQLGVEIPARPTSEFDALTWEQLIEMDSAGVQIESHTVTHPILTMVGEQELENELVRSKARLEKMLKRDISYFCYPNGDVDPKVRDAVVRAGYKGAVTTRFGFNGSGFDPFMVDRIYAPFPIQDFAQSASGFESFKQRVRSRIRA